LLRWASNHNPPDLCFLSSWGFRCESLHYAWSPIILWLNYFSGFCKLYKSITAHSLSVLWT
jgi:hypothetical protein